MSDHFLLIERRADWKSHFPDFPVVVAEDYLTRTADFAESRLRVINLCRSHRYLSEGYYCSLLAEARKHKVIPTVRTLQDLSRKAIYSLDTEDIDRKVARVLGRKREGLQPTAFEMMVYFGQCAPKEMQEIGQQLFSAFRAPLFKVEFRLVGQWRIDAIKPLGLANLAPDEENAFFTALEHYLTRPWRKPRGVMVIEVNDNPSIDAGVEDGVLKDGLYRRILEDMLRRLDQLRGQTPSKGAL